MESSNPLVTWLVSLATSTSPEITLSRSHLISINSDLVKGLIMNNSQLVQWLKPWSWSQTARVGISAPPLTNCDLGQTLGFPHGAGGKELTANAEAAGDVGLIPGLGRSPGGVHGSPLQYSCQENPVDRGASSMDRGDSPQGHKESDTTEVTQHAGGIYTYFVLIETIK